MPYLRGTRRIVRPWAPTDLGALLALWLDANDTNRIVKNGTNVSSWIDKSVRGNTVVQATASNQPGYVPASGSIPAGITTMVNTTPTLQTVANANVPIGSVPRFCVVCETLNSATVVNNSGEASINWGLRSGTTGGASSFGAFSNDPQYVGYASNLDSGQARNTARSIKSFYYDGTNMSIFKNGIGVAGYNGFGVNVLAAPLSVGGSSNFGYYFKGVMHGYVVGAIKSLDAMQRVEGWMSRAYNVPLPASHPYARSQALVMLS